MQEQMRQMHAPLYDARGPALVCTYDDVHAYEGDIYVDVKRPSH
jgi:hypothetical protein